MSFNSKKISQIIVKKDMLILRILEFQNSFQSIYFNPHSFTPQCILNSLAEAFEGIITFWNFLYSWIALRIEYRDFSSLLPILPIRTAHKPDMFILFTAALGWFFEVNLVIILLCNNCQNNHFDYKSNKNVYLFEFRTFGAYPFRACLFKACQSIASPFEACVVKIR